MNPPKDLTQQNAAALAYLREHRPDNIALKGIGSEMKCPKCPYTFTRPSPTDCCPDCGEFFYPDPIHNAAEWARTANIVPEVKVADVLAKLTEVRAERDALRLDLLSIQGCQEAALPGWTWVSKERVYAKWTDRGDPLVRVKADYSPPYLYDSDPRGGGHEWTGVGTSNRKIGFGCSASPRQAMQDADAAILKAARPKVPHAR